MNKSYLITALLAVMSAVVLYNQQHTAAPYSFEQYKTDYRKVYAREGEEAYRKAIFLRNLISIAEHNADATQTWQKGVNQFSDLTDAEFKAIYLTLTPPKKTIEVINEEMPSINGDIDWTRDGKVSGVKNQGACGSCWAFSATGAIESAYLFKGQNLNLSEQDLVDCSRNYGNQGCNGGWMDSAFSYVRDKGIASSQDYPYVARDQACQGPSRNTKVTGYTDVPGCDNLANALQGRPISVAVDASVWGQYRSGVITNCGQAINHGVLLVGIIDNTWRIKNSWGQSWGESGFVRLQGGNTCAICGYGSYPTI